MTDQEKLSILGFMELAIGRSVPFVVAWQDKDQIEVCSSMTAEALKHSVKVLQGKLERGEVDYAPSIPEFPS